MRQSLYEYCIKKNRQDLFNEWDAEKNADISMRDVSLSCFEKVWWRCAAGHSWKTSAHARTRGYGCPICVGKVVLEGETDLNTLFPTIAEQWDHEKNGSLKPTHVPAYSNKKVWWRCPLGHEYAAVIFSRTVRNDGCPYCSGQRVLSGLNDLKTQYPKVAVQWHYKLNGRLTPENVTPGSAKQVWWKCEFGHVWKAAIYSRTCCHSGCPVCAGKTNSPYYGIDYEALERKILAEQARIEQSVEKRN